MTAVTVKKLTLDGKRTFDVDPKLRCFDSGNLKSVPLLQRKGTYVQAGVAGHKVSWIAGYSAVVELTGPAPGRLPRGDRGQRRLRARSCSRTAPCCTSPRASRPFRRALPCGRRSTSSVTWSLCSRGAERHALHASARRHLDRDAAASGRRRRRVGRDAHDAREPLVVDAHGDAVRREREGARRARRGRRPAGSCRRTAWRRSCSASAPTGWRAGDDVGARHRRTARATPAVARASVCRRDEHGGGHPVEHLLQTAV